MLLETKGLRVFIFNSTIDMRSGFERLSYFARDLMKARLDQGHVYLFFGRNRRRIKALYFDGTGLVLVSKRMERGSFMSLAGLCDRGEISLGELKLIFHGSVIKRPVLERDFEKAQRTSERVELPRGSEVNMTHAHS